jgi:hypothetical protein
MKIFPKAIKQLFHSRKNLCDMDKIILEYSGKYIEYNVNSLEIKYGNSMPPFRPITYSYPDGYFDEKHFFVSSAEKSDCWKTVKKCLKNLPLDRNIDLLPCGAERNVCLYLVDKRNNWFYYSDTHATRGGFSVTTEPVEPSFFELVNFFEKYCDFPQWEFPQREIYDSVDPTEQSTLDERYYNETLWMCPQCHKGNLFEHERCAFCGADRS